MKSRRAQIQMGEIIIVMIVFFMLVGFGVIFFTQFAQGQAKKTTSEVTLANLAETAKIVSSLPEIHCSYALDEDLSCIDTYRAKVFTDALNSEEYRLHYSNAFVGYRLKLVCIYPESCANTQSYTLFDYTGNGQNEVPFIIPVYIYNPVTRLKSYGWLELTQVT